VFVGPGGAGHVQGMEIALLLQMFAERETRVIPSPEWLDCPPSSRSS
jgi:hypothetical protein